MGLAGSALDTPLNLAQHEDTLEVGARSFGNQNTIQKRAIVPLPMFDLYPPNWPQVEWNEVSHGRQDAEKRTRRLWITRERGQRASLLFAQHWCGGPSVGRSAYSMQSARKLLERASRDSRS